MKLTEIITKSRSYRRFYEDKEVVTDDLKALVDLARLSPSAANLQPLKFILSNTSKKNELIFNTLAWAGYLKDWKCPDKGEKPAAYIIILGDTKIRKGFDIDCGIAAQSIMLGAVEKGLGGCMFGSINRKQLLKDLAIPEHLEIVLVLALGYPKEKVIIDNIEENESIKYWREENGVHHVPKRKLNDIILD